MVLIQILLPVSDTSDRALFARTREELADRFGGATAYSRSPAHGVWISPEGEKERDSVLLVEVFAESFDRPWWQSYQKALASRFQQEEIHIRALQADVP
jgi:hypothetical protein